MSDPVGERWPFDELHHQRPNTVCFLQTVDDGDVRVIQRR
jgi:hypothetical protein